MVWGFLWCFYSHVSIWNIKEPGMLLPVWINLSDIWNDSNISVEECLVVKWPKRGFSCIEDIRFNIWKSVSSQFFAISRKPKVGSMNLIVLLYSYKQLDVNAAFQHQTRIVSFYIYIYTYTYKHIYTYIYIYFHWETAYSILNGPMISSLALRWKLSSYKYIRDISGATGLLSINLASGLKNFPCEALATAKQLCSCHLLRG